MIKHQDSHIDHGLTPVQLEWLLDHFAGRSAFFIETVELPSELGTVPCTLYGPLMGDAPIADDRVVRKARGNREYKSRLIGAPTRPTRLVTVIAGPHAAHPCVMYTAFGGPATPREPGDIRLQIEALEAKRRELPDRSPESEEHRRLYQEIEELRVKRAESDLVWGEHALAEGQ